MNILTILYPVLFLMAGKSTAYPGEQNGKSDNPVDLTLTILYDNYNFDSEFRNNWGFSCLIETPDRTILFDTGGDDTTLMENFRAAGKDPAGVDLVILSHIHWDHTGGLKGFLGSRTGIDVYLPASFPDDFKREIRNLGSTPVEIREARRIVDHVWTTGEMGEQIVEQSLILETPGGLVVLTGCAHPGIREIVAKARELKGDKILLVMGGMHLLRTDTATVSSIAGTFREQGIRYVSPTHCSGDGTLEIFKKTFGDRFIRAGAGRVINTRELQAANPEP